jgi:hypothetical protein
MEAVFNIQCPSRRDQKDLRYIFEHFWTNSAENSLTQHLRRRGCSQERIGHISNDVFFPLKAVNIFVILAFSQEQTKHNLLALMLLGMQSLANGPYWQILRIYTEHGLLEQVRENPQQVWAVIVEELHNHPPSAPILMPYRAKRNTTIQGQAILEGTIVVISPPWLLGRFFGLLGFLPIQFATRLSIQRVWLNEQHDCSTRSHAMMGGAPQVGFCLPYARVCHVSAHSISCGQSL